MDNTAATGSESVRQAAAQAGKGTPAKSQAVWLVAIAIGAILAAGAGLWFGIAKLVAASPAPKFILKLREIEDQSPELLYAGVAFIVIVTAAAIAVTAIVNLFQHREDGQPVRINDNTKDISVISLSLGWLAAMLFWFGYDVVTVVYQFISDVKAKGGLNNLLIACAILIVFAVVLWSSLWILEKRFGLPKRSLPPIARSKE